MYAARAAAARSARGPPRRLGAVAMIPIIIPGSVVRAASDGLKSIDDKVTGGSVQSKTGEAKKAAVEVS